MTSDALSRPSRRLYITPGELTSSRAVTSSSSLCLLTHYYRGKRGHVSVQGRLGERSGSGPLIQVKKKKPRENKKTRGKMCRELLFFYIFWQWVAIYRVFIFFFSSDLYITIYITNFFIIFVSGLSTKCGSILVKEMNSDKAEFVTFLARLM